MIDPAAPHQALRASTAFKHDEVDATFARYDLSDPTSYADFLIAHARILPPIERALATWSELPAFVPRASALAADLAALDRPMPAPDAVPLPDTAAAAWGMHYVVEGSRLGGTFLARAVPGDLPKAYLSAAHARGGWRALLAGLDEAATAGGPAWLDEARHAAVRTFDLYAAAADRAEA